MRESDILTINIGAYHSTYIIELLEQKIMALEGLGKGAVIAREVLDSFRGECIRAEKVLRYQEGLVSAKAFIDQIKGDTKIVNIRQAQDWALHYGVTVRDIVNMLNAE